MTESITMPAASGSLTFQGSGAATTTLTPVAGASLRLVSAAGWAITVADLSLSGGTAATGGAILAQKVVASDAEFARNSATGDGGAIAADIVEISRSTLSGNSADRGGAVYSGVFTSLADSTLQLNRATTWGGAVFALTESRMVRATFAQNSGKWGGAAVLGNATISESAFERNRAAGGGAVYATQNPTCSDSCQWVLAGGPEKLDIKSTRFVRNTALWGGALLGSLDRESTADPRVTFVIESSSFTQNSAELGGGAIRLTQSFPASSSTRDTPRLVKGTSFVGNTTQQQGGAVQVTTLYPALSASERDRLGFLSSEFRDNHAAVGGAIMGIQYSVQDSTLVNNSASVSGGALANFRPADGDQLPAIVVVGSRLSGNSAARGGAIDGEGLSIQASVLSANHADGDGGAVVGAGRVSFSTLVDNTATRAGALVGEPVYGLSTVGVIVSGGSCSGTVDEGGTVATDRSCVPADAPGSGVASAFDIGLGPLVTPQGALVWPSLRPRSVAVNSASISCDQKALYVQVRTPAGPCDSGAFERTKPAVMYVSHSPRDGGSCEAPDFNAAPEAAVRAISGDTIHVCEGEYVLDRSMTPTARDLVIEGDGPGSVLDGAGKVQIVDAMLLPISLRGLTLRNGRATKFPQLVGGAVAADRLTVDSVTFRGNQSVSGGAIYAFSTAFIIRSSFVDNRASSLGGAIAGTYATVVNSTFTGNSAAEAGTAVYADGAGLRHVTIDADPASTVPAVVGSHVGADGVAVRIYNSIVASSSATTPACQGLVVDRGGNAWTDPSCRGADGTSKVSTYAALDLQPLTVDGATPVIPLGEASAALDIGLAAACIGWPAMGTDQGGEHRPQGPGCDAGAYERPVVDPCLSGGPVLGSPTVGFSSPVDEDSLVVVPGSTLLAGAVCAANASISIVTLPPGWSGALQGDGIVLTPPANFWGDATVRFGLTSPDGKSNFGNLSVRITSVNDAPAARGDTYGTTSGTALEVGASQGLLANDTDVDGDSLTVRQLTEPGHGQIVLSADGAFRYTPEAGFSGSDSFQYVASDAVAQSIANVTIVTGPADLGPPGTVHVPGRTLGLPSIIHRPPADGGKIHRTHPPRPVRPLVLRLGSRDAAVVTFQRCLASRGYRQPVTGYLGRITLRNGQDFVRRHQWLGRADGTFGPWTRKAACRG